MGRAEARPAISRQEARDLVKQILTGTDESPGFVCGTVKLAPFPWLKGVLKTGKYQMEKDSAGCQALKAGLMFDDRARAYALVGRIHETWRDFQPEADSFSPDRMSYLIRDSLIAQGVLKKQPALKLVVALKDEPREPITNPFPVLGGRGPQWG